MKQKYRIGYGYDVHQLIEGRKFILGGIEIESPKGILGHSDADALLHSITDAILGACALGDIGSHFPDSDEKYKNADSGIFAVEANKLINELGYRIGNIDASIVLEKPRLREHIHLIRKNIAEMLKIDVNQISVKATTSEKMGLAGRGEGIIVHSVVLLERKDN